MIQWNGREELSRRSFLKSSLLAGATALAWTVPFSRLALGKLPPDIKITDLKTFLVGNRTFVKLSTSEGVTGVGEGSFTGRAKTVQAAIEEHRRLLIGRDPTEIERLWQQMFRWSRARSGPMINAAISAIDIALWDVLGKLLDVPIYKLLGGAARDSIRLYVHVQAPTEEAIADRVHKMKEEGFTAVRSGLAFQRGRTVERPWNLEHAVSLIEAMREAAGADLDILDDAHGMLKPDMALEYARAIEPYRLLFLEDPTQPEDLDSLRRIGRHTDVPLAIGESMHGKQAFREVIDERLVSYVRPDVIRVGGISEARKVAAMAEANFIDVALHVAPSPVSNLAAAHVAAACTGCTITENTGRPSRRSQKMQDLFMGGDITIEDGHAMLPEKPGLGCDLDEDLAEKPPYRPNDLPRLQYEDGTPSNW
jgi:galactonate dehydratase